MVIFKYDIDHAGHDSHFSIMLPKDYQILHVRFQYDKPVMWVLQDTLKPLINVQFVVYATGFHSLEIPDKTYYIATWNEPTTEVYHLFYESRVAANYPFNTKDMTKGY